MRRAIRLATQWPGALIARARAGTPRAPRFAGVYPSRAAALAALPAHQRSGYDDPSIADISFDWMCRRAAWDYPLIHWLSRLLPEGGRILDAGGHLGTKYIAFSDLLQMSDFAWTVYDLPGIVQVARDRQAKGDLPSTIRFVDDLAATPACDVLLGSGLVQYLDQPFETFLNTLPHRPRHILLNKVPLRPDAGVFTLERIGTARVPYQIRKESAWETEITAAGYTIVDSWDIAGLSHRIATHPWQEPCHSRGYLLRQNAGESPES